MPTETMPSIARDVATVQAWADGDTAALEGRRASDNPYIDEPLIATPEQRIARERLWLAWQRGFEGWPYDERGGFV